MTDHQRIAAALLARPDGQALLDQATQAGKDFDAVLRALVHLHAFVPALAERLAQAIEESMRLYRLEQQKEN